MKKILLYSLFSLGAILGASGAESAGYYDSCLGKSGKELLTALHNVVGNHTTVSYKKLLDVYKTSDVYPDGKIWDMYSTKHWTIGTTCGSYSIVGDCYNREHSIPQSWFNEASPMVSDAFHVYPTDGKVNGQRSNYPYGECAGGTTLSAPDGIVALGKLGKSTFAQYSGTVFEPADEYKGDFARTYFYMAAAYNDKIAGWSGEPFAGNNFPVYKTWVINMLLKWHRQDPVSQKELDRQEAVEAYQKNRNPFIDHPELAEYIWGDNSTEGWTPGGTGTTGVITPAAGSTVNMGNYFKGNTSDYALAVKTVGATENVTVSITGGGATEGIINATYTLDAAAANAGTSVNVKVIAINVGDYSATATVTAGTAKSVAELTAKCLGTIPIETPTVIYTDGFELYWTFVGDAYPSTGSYGEYYILKCSSTDGTNQGFTAKVTAKDGHKKVYGLNADTEYDVTLQSQNMSNTIRVRTGSALQSVEFLFDGDLEFLTSPGEPSDAAEILVNTANIDDDITIGVTAPFEVSADRTSWSQSTVISADETRIYMRLGAADAGTYSTSLSASAGEYSCTSAMIFGLVADIAGFLEDFEATEKPTSTYNTGSFVGSMCMWNLSDCGTFSATTDPAYSGKFALRAGKSASAEIRMEEDFPNGIRTASFYARRWSNDIASDINVEYSTDGGTTWRTAGTVTVDAADYKQYTVHVGTVGASRIRFKQASGKRFLLDDVALVPNTVGLAEPGALRHQWDAYSHGGTLYVESVLDGLEIAVYAIDGTVLFSGISSEGTMTFDGLEPGALYIVACGDFSRVILVR